MFNNLCQLTQKIIYNRYFSENVSRFRHILSLYNGDDWRNYIDSDDRIIHRNLKYSKTLLPYSVRPLDMYLLQWEPGAQSLIHGHGLDGCIMKVLEGELKEERYKHHNLNHIKDYELPEGSIKYIDNDLGFHRIINTNKDKRSYSLHIY